MTNEQREAIELLEGIRDNTWTTKYIISSDSKKADTVLSLIKEQQEEIEKLQKGLNEENKRCMILANNDKFKEQVIDLMAEYIEKVTVDLKVAFGENMLWNRNEIKQYFADLVEKE